MNLATLKQIEAKGKKKVVPMLRQILANPYKQHCPVLPENELLDFSTILKETITRSGDPGKVFATKSHIHLGLESSLRAINGQRFSCVFISLSLRPSHIVRLIASSAEAKIPTAPIYAQPKLENVTEELFGVRALVFVLPLDLEAISSELNKWVIAHQKPQIIKAKPQIVPEKAKRKKPKTIREEPKKSKIVEKLPPKPAEQKDWSGDYISCLDGGALQIHEVDIHVETQQLGSALAMLTANKSENVGKSAEIQTKEPDEPKIEPLHLDAVVAASDEDDFLAEHDLSVYKTATVLEIRANPDKKPKKKRNKKKNKTNK